MPHAGYRVALLQEPLPPVEAGYQRRSADLLLLQPVVLPLHRKSTRVDAVIFEVTAKPAIAEQQKALKIRQRFCVNKMDFGSTSGERQISAREPDPNIADAVSAVVADYVQKSCTSGIQGSTRFYGSPVNEASLRQRQWFAGSFATRMATAKASRVKA